MKRNQSIGSGRYCGRPGIPWTVALCLGMALAAAPWAGAVEPRLELGGVSSPPGGVLLLPVTYTASDDHLASTLVARIALPVGQVEVLDVLPGAGLEDLGKTLDFEVQGDELALGVFGGQRDIETGVLCRLLLRVQPGVAAPNTLSLTDVDTHGADKDAQQVSVQVDAGSIQVVPGAPHKADVDGDWRISLSELLRLIQLYNVGAHQCDGASQDGYAPGPGAQDCAPHDADYAPEDWRISFFELLRMIQLYNGPHGVYHVRAGSEDGFAPGPFGIRYDAP